MRSRSNARQTHKKKLSTLNISCNENANIKTHVHKQPDPEQLFVGATNICSSRALILQHALQQPIIQKLRHSWRQIKYSTVQFLFKSDVSQVQAEAQAQVLTPY